MSKRDLDSAFELIDANGGGDFEGEKAPLLIARAEQALGLTFPPTYKEFLARLGCGDIGGLELFGIIGNDFENSSVPDAIWLTLEERKAGLPEALVLIYAAGDGSYYALDTSQVDAAGESPVVAWELNGSSRRVAEDYGSFLLQELRTVFS